MTSQERVLTALRLGQPDRVPVIDSLIDMKVGSRAAPGCRDMADCMDRLGMDAVTCAATFQVVEERSDGRYVDEWGATYERNEEAVSHPLAGPISSRADAVAYVAPDPDAPHRLGVLPDLVARYKGNRAIIFHCRAAFMWSAFLMGLDEILMGFLTDPDTVEIVLDKVLEANIRVARNAVRAGAEIIMLGDDYADNRGPMMSPALFERFILPRLARMIEAVHAEGGLCIKHTDGNIYKILDMLVEAGPDGINPIEPVAGMELKRVKDMVGGRVCVVGNIDCGHLLPLGTPEEVRAAVREAIADAADGGGYILSSSNSIHSSCRPENVVAMVDACREYGLYS